MQREMLTFVTLKINANEEMNEYIMHSYIHTYMLLLNACICIGIYVCIMYKYIYMYIYIYIRVYIYIYMYYIYDCGHACSAIIRILSLHYRDILPKQGLHVCVARRVRHHTRMLQVEGVAARKLTKEGRVCNRCIQDETGHAEPWTSKSMKDHIN